MVGRYLRDTGTRDSVVLATKFGFNAGASPLAVSTGKGNPNAGGAGAKNVRRAVDASLARLGTDRIDLYWMHVWDGVTPASEIVQTLGDLVRAGKILHYALSDMPAWMAMQVATIAAERGVPGPIAMQVEYSLVARGIEEEHVPAARAGGMGVMPWSPLAGGFLTGKYRPEDTSSTGRLSGANPFGETKFSKRNWEVLDALREVAEELQATPAQVALAWVMGRPGVTSTILGASRVSQLRDNLDAVDLVLPKEAKVRLDTAGAPVPGFSASLGTPTIRRMIFGGHDVASWADQG